MSLLICKTTEIHVSRFVNIDPLSLFTIPSFATGTFLRKGTQVRTGVTGTRFLLQTFPLGVFVEVLPRRQIRIELSIIGLLLGFQSFDFRISFGFRFPACG